MSSQAPKAEGATIPWRRVWLSRRVLFQPGYDGYFPSVDPSRFTGPMPEYTALDQLDHIRGLVLLGDPGMGKSVELRAHCQQLRVRYGKNAVCWGDVQDTKSLEQTLAEITSSQLHPYLAQHSGAIFVLIDTLDCSEDRVSRGAKHLHALLTSLDPRDRRRVRLRLTCRTADWSDTHERDLSPAFEQTPFAREIPFGTYLLAPLTRADVAMAATKRGIVDSDRFIEQVGRTQAQGLAERPLTLRLLLEAAMRGQALPRDTLGIWRDGLMQLCSETNAVREEDASDSRATPEDILECAEHLAALTTLTGGSCWNLDSSRDRRPWNASTVHELRINMTYRAGPPRDALPGLVRSTLRSGLFAKRSDSLQFAHRAYAEFLTAECLNTRQLPTEDALRLLRDPNDPRGKILSHLTGVAGWLAAMNTDVRNSVAEQEPQVLLRTGDCYDRTDVDRAQLVDRILDGLEKGTLAENSYDAPLYSGLLHPGIEEQLALRLHNPSTPDAVWRVARSMAAACNVPLPFGKLAQIACDTKVPPRRRAFAATLVVESKDTEAKQALAPVLREPEAPDGVYGLALCAHWPAYLSAEALTALLRPPRDETISDEYDYFLSGPLFSGINNLSSLAVLLRGLGSCAVLAKSRTLTRVVEQLMFAAWTSMHDAAVADALAEVLLARLLDVVRYDSALRLDSITGRSVFINGAGSQQTSAREQTVIGEDLRQSLLERLIHRAAQDTTIDEPARDRITDILVLAIPPLVPAGYGGWISKQVESASHGRRVWWNTLLDRLSEMETVLASGDEHRKMVRTRSWLQNVHSWREGDGAASAEVRTSSLAVIEPPAPKPERSIVEQRNDYGAQREAIQYALAKARMPIRGPSDLLDAVLVSLRRLERELQGETPLAFALWNEEKGTCSPKHEDDLSDLIKIHLIRDLRSKIAVVVTREPEIRRGEGYLDLLIEAPGFADGRVHIILEVKRSTNPGLRDAMRTQLCERYLRETGAKFGLYVVGWFASLHWRDSPRTDTVEVLRAQLATQAGVLSKEFGVRIESFVLDCRLNTLRTASSAGSASMSTTSSAKPRIDSPNAATTDVRKSGRSRRRD